VVGSVGLEKTVMRFDQTRPAFTSGGYVRTKVLPNTVPGSVACNVFKKRDRRHMVKSSRNSDPGSTQVTSKWSRARVQAT
jgi:hypothetical protein